ncbi:MAG: peptide chain release factor-like protein [Nitrospirota bacterium]
MSNSSVSTEKWKALERRLQKLGISEDDLEERFVRSSGHGGQNVNKVSTCVMLIHRPSGLLVRCQEARTQGMNRYIARRRLAEKMEEILLGAESRHQQEIEKIRRQKRRRNKRAKEKMLQEKHHRSDIKLARGPVKDED